LQRESLLASERERERYSRASSSILVRVSSESKFATPLRLGSRYIYNASSQPSPCRIHLLSACGEKRAGNVGGIPIAREFCGDPRESSTRNSMIAVDSGLHPRMAKSSIPMRIIRADQDVEALSRGCRHGSRRDHAEQVTFSFPSRARTFYTLSLYLRAASPRGLLSIKRDAADGNGSAHARALDRTLRFI